MADAPLTIGEVVRRSAQYFAGVGSPSPRLDADLVIAHALGLDAPGALHRVRPPADHGRARRLRGRLVARRGRREPMAYILGHRAFRRLDLEVSPAVLVPRPETEVLVEWVLELVAPGAAVLDWGTGSGAIALALADEGPDLAVTAIDASDDALALARANGARLGLTVEWCRSDGFAALRGPRLRRGGGQPAVPVRGRVCRSRLRSLASSRARRWSAARAATRRSPASPPRRATHLRPGGAVVCEIGETPGRRARALLGGARGSPRRRCGTDLAGLPRVVMARRG